jgi:hypothetical protein
MSAMALALTGTSIALSQSATADPASHAAAATTTKGGPTASQLLAKAKGCSKKLTKKPLQKTEDDPRNVNICGANGGVFYTADMEVDCDGQETTKCNEDTDCCFQDDTTFHQSDGKPFDAAKLPYIVMPRSSSNFEQSKYGIKGGEVAAIIYKGKVEYAIWGDTDSPNKVGEASYAAAKGLGIDPDPKSGGVEGGVTYIVFANTVAKPTESHDSAVTLGEAAATKYVSAN